MVASEVQCGEMSSTKRKFGADEGAAFSFGGGDYHHSGPFQQSGEHVIGSMDYKRRRPCWEGELTMAQRGQFSISSTSAFHSTSLRSPISSIHSFSQTPSSNQFQGFDDGDTDAELTPASLGGNPISSSHAMSGTGMDFDDPAADAMDEDECPHSLSQSSWFYRLGSRRSSRTAKTAENVLFTSRHYVFPPNGPTAVPSSGQVPTAPTSSCMYCLRQYVTGPPSLMLPAAANTTGGYLSCNYCDRVCCAETCLRTCESCHGSFCGVCSTTDYSSAFERFICLDCFQR